MACWVGGDLLGCYPRSGRWLTKIDGSHGLICRDDRGDEMRCAVDVDIDCRGIVTVTVTGEDGLVCLIFLLYILFRWKTCVSIYIPVPVGIKIECSNAVSTTQGELLGRYHR
jgi:hypothetical protein